MSGTFCQTQRPRKRPTIYGRDRERAQLRESLDDAVAGRGSLVLVSGEAGIGKTTLVDDLIATARVQECLILTGGCYDLTTTPPYGPWAEVIGGYDSVEGEAAGPGWFADPWELERMGSQDRLFDETRRFFAGIAVAQPLVAVLEDLHWSDDASLHMLRALARDISDLRILLIGSYRDDELHRQNALYHLLPAFVREARAERIELRRLARDDVRALVSRLYQLVDDDLERLVDYLYRRSDGNPFFLTELLRMLEVDGQLQFHDGDWHVEGLSRATVPALVRQLVDGRLSRLGSVTRGLLDVAAVIGQEIPFALWQEVAGVPEDELLAAIQHAIDGQIIEPVGVEGSMRFRHALIRDAIYADTGLPSRRGWHRRTAERLIEQGPQEPDTIADHLLRAGDSRAAGWFVVAGDNARKLYSHQTAIGRYDRALDHDQWLSPKQQVAALRGRAIARESSGDFDGTRADHEAVLALASQIGDLYGVWQALIDLGLLWASRDYARSGDYLRQALAQARKLGDPKAVGRSLNRLGNWHGNAGDPQRGEQMHLEALEIFQRLDDRHMLAETYDLLGMAMVFRGDHFLVAKYQRQAEALFREMDDHESLSRSLLVLANLRPDFASGTTVPAVSAAESIRYGAESIEHARQAGSRSIESWSLSSQGWHGLAAQGEYGLALEHVRAGLALAEKIEHDQWTVYALLGLGTIYLELLAYAQARQYVERALTIAKQVNTRFFIEAATALLCRIAIADNDIETAESLLATVTISSNESDVRENNETKMLCARAELALALGDTAAALKIADSLLDSIPNTATDRVPPMPALLRADSLIRLGRYEEAEAALRELERMALDLGAESALWRLHARLANLYHLWDRGDDAATEISIARPLIDEIAGRIAEPALRENFRAQVLAHLLPPDDTALAMEILSPREIEVLGRVAEGLTDAEVAGQLSISPRTVGTHLTSIYNKLGVTSRTAAARAALERDIISLTTKDASSRTLNT